METPINQPPRLKLAAPSGAAAAIGGQGPPTVGLGSPAGALRGQAPQRGLPATGPQSQRQERAGRTASRRSVAPGLDGKSCGPAPSVLEGQAASPVLTGSEELGGDTPSAPARRGEPARLLSGTAGPPWSEHLHSHCCSVLTVVWDDRRLIAQGT